MERLAALKEAKKSIEALEEAALRLYVAEASNQVFKLHCLDRVDGDRIQCV